MKHLLLSFLVFLIGLSVNGQSIYHPSGKTHSNITIKPGVSYTYYDDGGPTGNYGAGTSSLLTIYPSKKGEYVSISCNSFDINSDCRMYIFDGNHPGADIIGYYYLRSTQRAFQFKPGDVVTASEKNPSGALTVRFTNAERRATMPGWEFTVSCTKTPGKAPIETTQDCSGAIKVCSDSAITTKASGYHFQELPGPHFWNIILNYGNDGENQSNWYKFEVATPGTIEFTIRPHKFTDFDWALWGPYNAHECPAWTADKPYRLSSCDGNYSQVTGLSTSVTDTYEDSYGDGFVKAIDVKAGEHYVIMIDDWSGNSSTFDLTWKFSNGASLECKRDKDPPTTPPKDSIVEVEVIDLCKDEMKVSADLKVESAESLGEIDLKIRGGSPPYTFTWKDENGTLLGSSEDLYEVSGGQYKVEITDTNDCKVTGTFTVKTKDKYVDPDEEPHIEAEISKEQDYVTVSYPGAFEYKIENMNSETVITGHAVDSDVVEITDLPPGQYRVSLIYKQIKQYTTFVKH